MMRVVVIDDEALARRRLKRLLAPHDDVEIAGEAADGEAAARLITTSRPDLVFLDVQMPERDGIAVAQDLPKPRPAIVFVTAFDHYAVQAFELHAVDYLLKPVTRERLSESLARVRRRGGTGEMALARLLERFAPRQYLERVPVRSGGRVDLVDAAAIDWIEAANNYVVLHAGRSTYVLRSPLQDLETSLDPRRFVRIHRSTIVALNRIVRLDTADRGDYDVVLRDGTILTLSRTHKKNLSRILGKHSG